MKVKFRAEFDSLHVRSVSIQCPHCKNWFYQYDVIKNKENEIHYGHDFYYNEFSCPICKKDFETTTASTFEIEECENVHRDSLKKIVKFL